MNSIIKKTLFYFFSLYFGSIMLFFGLLLYLYYQKELQKADSEITKMMNLEKERIESILKNAHMERKKAIIKSEFSIRLYDIDENLIATFGKIEDGFKIESYQLEPYYLGIAKIVLASENKIKKKLKKELLFIFLVGVLFFGAIGYFLSKIILKPINSAYKRLDQFIEDVTHELNTPITIISMALKLLSKDGIENKNLSRIEIGAKNLSKIYEELLYLKFEHKESESESLNLDEVIREQIDYFRVFAEAKRISINSNLIQKSILISKNDFIKLFGNLLQNSIKYSKEGGNIEIVLTDDRLCVKDDGIGIDESKKELILKRYERADGGYTEGLGIGLSIVKSICNKYGFKIEIDSKLNVGTKICIIF